MLLLSSALIRTSGFAGVPVSGSSFSKGEAMKRVTMPSCISKTGISTNYNAFALEIGGGIDLRVAITTLSGQFRQAGCALPFPTPPLVFRTPPDLIPGL
jgi:hypothetical protein